MTPFELDILLHYYSLAGDHEVVRNNPPVWKETRGFFLESGLLMNDTGAINCSYCLTDKGHAYIEAILEVPLPVAKWIVDYGGRMK